MKPHGKGRAISINEPNQTNWATLHGGGLSKVNAWKQELGRVPPPPVPVFKPLASWPAVKHPRQSELEQFKAMPSRYADGR